MRRRQYLFAVVDGGGNVPPEDPVWSQGSPWTPPGGNKPLVLVSMSSTFQDQIGPLRRVIEALGTLPFHGIVTTGPAIDAAALNAVPNVTVLARAPHREVLRHAAAVVTHGGHGTVVKALAAGVPMVLIPHGRDQGDTAVRITARGAGIALKRTAQPEAIAAAVTKVLSPPHDSVAGVRSRGRQGGVRRRHDRAIQRAR